MSSRPMAARDGPNLGQSKSRLINNYKGYSADQNGAREVVGSNPSTDKGIFLHSISVQF